MLFTYKCDMASNKKCHCLHIVSIAFDFEGLHCAGKNPDEIPSDEWAME